MLIGFPNIVESANDVVIFGTVLIPNDGPLVEASWEMAFPAVVKL